jgi:hypothetical protein
MEKPPKGRGPNPLKNIQASVKYILEEYMADMILDVQTLPEPILSRIHTPKVKVHEENGIITLTPIKMERENIDKFIGMFSGGKLSSEKFIQNKTNKGEPR